MCNWPCSGIFVLSLSFFLSLHPRDNIRGRFILIWHPMVWTIWLDRNDKLFTDTFSSAKEFEDKCVFFLGYGSIISLNWNFYPLMIGFTILSYV